MNRLIIIGNGYDKAIAMKTGYSDFVEQLLLKTCSYAMETHSDYNIFLLKKNDIGTTSIYKKGANRIENFAIFIEEENIEIISLILKQTVDDIENKGWADIEQIYFNLLLDIYQEIKNRNNGNVRLKISEQDRNKIKNLNFELKEIKKELINHLQKEEEKYHKKNIIAPFSCNKFLHPFIEDDFDEDTWNKYKLDKKNPEKTCVLNFNYTDPFLKFRNGELIRINIHGRLGDNLESIVFGYGDEFDQRYKEIENLYEDLFLENFKSFSYIKSPDYNKMLGFIESGDFQIFIVGHSCAMSDKTLLKEIFESKFCISIKVFYHEKEDENGKSDNFDEISFNISRIMDNKPKLRKVIAKKYQGCKFEHIQ